MQVIMLSFVCKPTQHELRQKNQSFAKAAREGRKPTKPSRQERLEKQSPVPLWVLALIVFVVCGGGERCSMKLGKLMADKIGRAHV